MIKKNDVVLTHDGKVAVVARLFTTNTRSPLALVRFYRTNRTRIDFVNGLRSHKWLND